MKKILVLFTVLLLLVACGESDKPGNDAQTYAEKTVMYDKEAAGSGRTPGTGASLHIEGGGKKIVKTASLEFEVKNLDSSLARLGSLISGHEGYIQQENQFRQMDRLYYRLHVRIPEKYFDAFIGKVLSGDDIRRLESKRVSARDVTEEYIDAESRLTTKRQALERYRDLLKKAESVSDMIAVEENIRRLEEEIEAQEKRLEYLSRQVAMSEVRIELYQALPGKYVPEKPFGFASTFVRSLHKGWQGVVTVFFWIIRLWPLWVLLILLKVFMRARKKEDE
ncbi:MAG: DUF4349 domain-containing protein [Fidelibacterota bacterium]